MKAQILTQEALKSRVPAAFASGRDTSSTSERYAFTSTARVLNVLAECGWHAHQASQMHGRVRSNEHQRHLVRLFNPALAGGENMAELLITNSHNGASQLAFFTGVFRFVCMNGLITPTALSGSLKVRHIGEGLEDEIVEVVREHAGRVEIVMGSVEKMRSTQVSLAEQMVLAQAAAELKFGDDLSKVVIDVRDFLRVHRAEDKKNDLWTVFNTVQENLIRGGVSGYNVETHRQFTTKAVKNIDLSLKLNQGIFEKALALVA